VPVAKTIRKDKEFAAVLKQGYSAGGLVLRVKALRKNQESSRYGLIINTKVSKKAVERNRLRRRLRAILHDILPKLKGTHDLVLIMGPVARDMKSADLAPHLIAALRQLRIL
jgi:ribonuclease P protein component